MKAATKYHIPVGSPNRHFILAKLRQAYSMKSKILTSPRIPIIAYPQTNVLAKVQGIYFAQNRRQIYRFILYSLSEPLNPRQDPIFKIDCDELTSGSSNEIAMTKCLNHQCTKHDRQKSLIYQCLNLYEFSNWSNQYDHDATIQRLISCHKDTHFIIPQLTTTIFRIIRRFHTESGLIRSHFTQHKFAKAIYNG